MTAGRNLLVTGGAGFIGANFVQYWVRRHPQDHVVVLDALTYAGNSANLRPVQDRPQVHFVQGDVGDRAAVETLLGQHAIDTIVHFAAESHVDRSIVAPEAFIQTNVLGTFTLLEAARAYWGQAAQGPCGTSGHPYRFHHVSTDEVYGSLDSTAPAFTETSPYAPNSPYAASKAASDHLVRAYHQTYGLPVTTSHCSNNYGPYQFPEKLLPLMLLHALAGKPLPLYGDGRNVRDWLYVEDHCRGLERVVAQGRVGETYNIGGNNAWANIDLVTLMCRLLDEAFSRDASLKGRFPQAPAATGKATESLIAFVKDRPGHDRRYAINASKAMAELGYHPQESLASGLGKTIQWYVDHEAWWRGVMDGSYREWMHEQYGGERRQERTRIV
jgi:dTDP-glucose 4,6-dehydratase